MKLTNYVGAADQAQAIEDSFPSTNDPLPIQFVHLLGLLVTRHPGLSFLQVGSQGSQPDYRAGVLIGQRRQKNFYAALHILSIHLAERARHGKMTAVTRNPTN
jgi:hypothetical protein